MSFLTGIYWYQFFCFQFINIIKQQNEMINVMIKQN